MSYDLLVLRSGRARTGDEVVAWIERADRGDHVDVDAPTLRAFETELAGALGSRSQPHPIEDEAAVAHVAPGRIEIEIAWSKVGSVAPTVLDLAARHGLTVFDPQSERLFGPDDPPPAGSEWRRASEPFEAVLGAIQRGGPAAQDPLLAFDSSDPPVRAQTALELAWASDQESLAALRRAIADDPNPRSAPWQPRASCSATTFRAPGQSLRSSATRRRLMIAKL